MESSTIPIPLCNKCGEALDSRGQCTHCGTAKKVAAPVAGAIPARKPTVKPLPPVNAPQAGKPVVKPNPATAPPAGRQPQTKPPEKRVPALDDQDIMDLPTKKPAKPQQKRPGKPTAESADEFWSLPEQ